MTKDEALKLALEALEYLATQIKPDYEHSKAITAIKAALANEALERKAENARELGLDYYVPCCTDKTCSKCKAALEAKDEPVANNWSVFNTGAEVWEKLSLADAVVELTPSRLERG